jgi:hypothetical protein
MQLNNRDYSQPTVQLPCQIAVNRIIFSDGTVQITADINGPSPAPPNMSIQFNNNGVFGGSPNLTWNNAISMLVVAGSINISGQYLINGVPFGFPAPPNQSVQFNSSGAFGGSPNLIWDNANSTLVVNGDVNVSDAYLIQGNRCFEWGEVSKPIAQGGGTEPAIQCDQHVNMTNHLLQGVSRYEGFTYDPAQNAATGIPLFYVPTYDNPPFSSIPLATMMILETAATELTFFVRDQFGQLHRGSIALTAIPG